MGPPGEALQPTRGQAGRAGRAYPYTRGKREEWDRVGGQSGEPRRVNQTSPRNSTEVNEMRRPSSDGVTRRANGTGRTPSRSTRPGPETRKTDSVEPS